MAEERQSLDIEEQNNLAEAVLRIVAGYPDFPSTITEKKIHLDSVDKAEEIGVLPTAGAVIIKQYISGSFEAQFPFMVCYKCNPTTNQAVVEKRTVLENLCKWMKGMEYPALSDGRKILQIEQTTNVVKAGEDESGASIFQCGCRLKYFKKRS